MNISNLHKFLRQNADWVLADWMHSFMNISNLHKFLRQNADWVLADWMHSFMNISNLHNFLSKMQIGCLLIGCTVS
jgi:isochorismate hydrolase